MDWMISTLIPRLLSTTLKPSCTDVLLWLRRKEPQIRPKVDLELVLEAVKVEALRCNFLLRREAIFNYDIQYCRTTRRTAWENEAIALKIGEIEAHTHLKSTRNLKNVGEKYITLCIFWGRSCVWKSAKGSRLHYASGSGVGKSTVITATLGTVVAHCSDDHIKELKQDFFFCLLSR